MNRSFFALLIALLVHLVLLLLFLRIDEMLPVKTEPKPQEKKMKVSLKQLEKPKELKKSDSPVMEKEVQSIPEMPVMPKGSQIKEVIKKAPVEYKPKAKPKKPKLNPKPKPEKPKPVVEKVQPLPPKETHIKVPTSIEKKELEPKIEKPIEKKKEETSMDWLLEDKSDEIQEENNNNNKSLGTSTGRNIKELYGDKFGELSPGQQEYILSNQEIMRRITQGVLNRQARVSSIENINVNRSNVIEFNLHPDGSMSDFKFLDKSGYFMLDEITRVTIEYAYAKYPRPTETTLIRYNVFYNLRRY